MPKFPVKNRQLAFVFPKRLQVRIRPAPMDILEDYLLAARYCYYVKAKSVMIDADYDLLERKFLDEGHEESQLRKPGSDLREDYSPAIQALGAYLLMSQYERELKANGGRSSPQNLYKTLKLRGVICPNCGVLWEKNVPKCPSCGTEYTNWKQGE